jgi:hypothetical protein
MVVAGYVMSGKRRYKHHAHHDLAKRMDRHRATGIGLSVDE